MKTSRHQLLRISCFLTNQGFVPNDLPFFPVDWQLKANFELMDCSEVTDGSTQIQRVNNHQKQAISKLQFAGDNISPCKPEIKQVSEYIYVSELKDSQRGRSHINAKQQSANQPK